MYEKSKKLVYILALLAFLCATFMVFAGCEQYSPIPQQSTPAPMQVVLRVYTAEYCGPCRAQKPYVDAVKNSNKISVEIVDVTNDSSLATNAGISNLPCYQVFINGQLYWQGNSIDPVYRQVVGGG